jgi:hypothetical protein
MHSGKTESILLTSKRKKHLQKDFVINYAGKTVKPSETVKYLGLKIDSTVSGDKIVDSIVSKCNSRLKFMYRYKDILNVKTKKLLTSALIQCHFDYASTAWYSALTKQLKRKLQVAQNKIARFILNLHHRAHIGQEELDRICILCVADRAKQLMLNHMFNVANGTAPAYLCKQFTHVNRLHNTRYSEHNFMTESAHSIANNNFSVNGTREWNALPSALKTCSCKLTYKKLVKSYLKSQSHLRLNDPFIYY